MVVEKIATNSKLRVGSSTTRTLLLSKILPLESAPTPVLVFLNTPAIVPPVVNKLEFNAVEGADKKSFEPSKTIAFLPLITFSVFYGWFATVPCVAGLLYNCPVQEATAPKACLSAVYQKAAEGKIAGYCVSGLALIICLFRKN